MHSAIITHAASGFEALGLALEEVNVGPSLFVADYTIKEMTLDDVSTDAERQLEIVEETFFNLLEISSMSIMQKVHNCLSETNVGVRDFPNKIPAIKLLREHIKPFIGLKNCKEIVELWIDEIMDDMPKTSLINVVKMKMGYPV
jgi:ribosomal protein L7/L12